MLNISNIQHFSVGDGAGIRTTVFFKGCNLCCPWCHNPENLKASPVMLYYKELDKREILGRKVSVEEILPELLEDKAFYDSSHGGVTFSGGEVMLQANEASHLAKALKEKGVSVLIDTAGNVAYENFQVLNPFVDGYLFDFKTAEAEKYKAIGGDISVITDNIIHLIQDGMKVYIRIPLIPNFNIEDDQIEMICDCLKNIGIESVHLLPFHRLGKSKYTAMGLDYQYGDVLPLSKQETEIIKSIYSKYFIIED